MKLAGLIDLLATDPNLHQAIDLADAGSTSLDLTSPPSSRAAVAATLADKASPMILLVASTFREAEDLSASLEGWLGADQVAHFPAWETLPHERLSPRSDTVGRRLTVLRRIAGRDVAPVPRVVVTAVRSLLQPQVTGLAELEPVRIARGDQVDTAEVIARLVAAAYSRVDMVQRRGEFAVRGGIIDVFPPTFDHPVRIDFFGDEVEEIRLFTVADQRSSDEALDSVTADPCRELLVDARVQQRAAELLPDHPELADMLERISQGQAVEGMEALTPVLAEGLELLIDVLPSDAMVLLSDPELVRSRAVDLVRTSHEFLEASWSGAAGGGSTPIDLGASAYWDLADVRAKALENGQSWWSLSGFAAGPEEDEDSQALAIEPINPWRGDVEGAVNDIRQAVADRWTTVLVVDGKGLGDRMIEVLGEHDIPARWTEPDERPEPGVVGILTGIQRHGFRVRTIELALFTTADLAGDQAADKAARKMPSRRKNQIEPLELRPGDPIVHEQHGVGRYVEMTTRTMAGATREYLVIEYAASKRGQPGDRLFVPMDSLDLVTRYVGGENPTLDRMGGADWRARKSRARKAVKQIAAELIQLYAARQASRGHAFAADTVWQRELEDAFAFVETPDQLATLDEVKRDMESIIPMDRLVCGDVGYGKTEIAVRAAFKAVQDGKQVAVLVPTTLLVTQHYNTFAGRYAGFPIRVAQMSRFQTDKEIAETKEGLANGRVDIVIGTHRLFGKDIEFKDLGLVIVDEEQRFGVEHKERLKQMRLNVDVLSMSATPIPRTLEMAITGIREMSTIATPPEERHPVLTFAGPYDEAQVRAAVRRELAREGQVFVVHNRVQSIEKVARRLRELVPEARVVTAHGQMSESALEQVMLDFAERRADVLVSTTIVEAGLDIQTANTLIIDRADVMGLSQLHQIRGRVGRGRERGYAYFLYPPDKPLTEAAHDRLSTMAANTELGSGMAIAMKDLEIRGAGNLLGGEQSGHIADVGFDLYIRLVGEAVANFRGEGTEESAEMRIDIPVDAHLPVDYVESERLRLEMYKRIAESATESDLADIAAELDDRYGPFGAPVQALLDVARFRMQCQARGISEVTVQGTRLRLAPRPDVNLADLPESRQLRMARLYPEAQFKKALNLITIPIPRPTVAGPVLADRDLLEWATRFITDIFPELEPATEEA